MSAKPKDTWPKNPDGTNKKMGEMTKAEQLRETGKALKRLNKEFAGTGIKIEFGGEWKGKK